MIQHFPSVLLYFSFKIKVISLLHIHTAAIDSLSPPAVFVIQLVMSSTRSQHEKLQFLNSLIQLSIVLFM